MVIIKEKMSNFTALRLNKKVEIIAFVLDIIDRNTYNKGLVIKVIK